MTPTMPRMLGRGLLARCPWCGARGVFRGMFTIRERCPRCALRFQADEGDWLGAATLSYGVAAIVWIGMLIVWIAVSLPGIDIVPLAIASVAVVTLVGLGCSRPAKTTWSALQLILAGAHRRLDPDDAERFGLPRIGSDGAVGNDRA